MPQVPGPDEPLVRTDSEVWASRIVPAARACERFFWNLLWFALLACLLFSYNPFR